VRSRITGVDAARGAALLGMIATHVYPADDGRGALSTAHLIAAGRAAAAFAVLAGVALTLGTARAARPYRATLVRALGIGAIGLAIGPAHAGIAVILPYYAVLFVLALPLLRAPARVLGAVAGTAIMVVPVLSQLVRRWLPEPALDNPTFGALLTSPGPTGQELLLTGYYPTLAWLGYLCVGMAVGRLDLRSTRTAWRLVGAGVAASVIAAVVSWLLLGPFGGRSALESTAAALPGVGAVPAARVGHQLEIGLFGTTPTGSWWWLAVDTPHSTTPLDLVHTTGAALALLGAMLLVTTYVRLRALAAAGAMTLSLYTLHVVVLGSSLLPADPTRSFLLQTTVALLLATLWPGRRGPAEAVIASLTRRTARGRSPRRPIR
jgi:hypothetical protein